MALEEVALEGTRGRSSPKPSAHDLPSAAPAPRPATLLLAAGLSALGSSMLITRRPQACCKRQWPQLPCLRCVCKPWLPDPRFFSMCTVMPLYCRSGWPLQHIRH